MPAPRFHPFVRLFLCAAGLIGIQIVVGVALLAVAFVVSPDLFSPAKIGGLSNQILELSKKYALPLTVALYPISLVWLALCREQFDLRSRFSLGLRVTARAFPNFLRGALAGIGAIGLLWLILWQTGALVVSGWSTQALSAGIGGSLGQLALYGAMFLAVGFFEEVLFRGYITHNLYAWMGWRAALWIQAILFALVHVGNGLTGDKETLNATLGALPSLALIGIFFALCWRKTGSLWFPIGFHFAWNWSLGCLFSLPVSGIETFRLLNVISNPNSALSGGSFGAEGSFYLIPILLALIWFVRAAPDHPQALLDLDLMRGEIPLSLLQSAPSSIEEEELEEPRTNRFGARFGSAQGFDSKMLQELQELAQQREKAAAQAAQEAQNQARVEFPTVIAEPKIAVVEPTTSIAEPSIAVVESEIAIVEPKNPIVEPQIAIEEAKTAVPPAPVAPVKPSTSAPTPEAPAPLPKKKSAPRW